jgi:hypothetical protein
MLRGGELDLFDFRVAFIATGLICAIATVLFLRLPANAGYQLSRRSIEHAAETSELI